MKLKELKLKNLFKEEDSRFLLMCGGKFAAIFLLCCAFIYYITWVILSLNNVYFESYGFFTSPEFREAFFDNALSIFYQRLPYIFGFIIFLFFAGMYIGKILLRPFEEISSYCIKRVEGKVVSYNPDIFSDYKLLTRFSDFFFRYTDECLKGKELKSNTIPQSYSSIRGPRFERVFFFHFMLFISIIAIIGVTFVFYITGEIQQQIVDLSLVTFKESGSNVAYFLDNQKYILHSIGWFSVVTLITSYILLAFHLYGSVAGAIFGFFATMRSFMKGNFHSRVHLIGYAQIRPHGRSLNKFLDYVERECEKK